MMSLVVGNTTCKVGSLRQHFVKSGRINRNFLVLKIHVASDFAWPAVS